MGLGVVVGWIPKFRTDGETMNQKTEKKTYSTPKLVVYGDVREITQAVGNMGSADGGAGGTSKTSP